MINISMDTSEITLKLDKMAKALKDYSVPFTKSGEDIVVYVGIRIFEQGGYPQARWQPLSPATLFMRQEQRGYYAQNKISSIDKILVWCGRLRSGFQKSVEPLSITIYNNVYYFKKHQLGDGVPQRKMLILDPTMVKLVQDRINDYIKSMI